MTLLTTPGCSAVIHTSCLQKIPAASCGLLSPAQPNKNRAYVRRRTIEESEDVDDEVKEESLWPEEPEQMEQDDEATWQEPGLVVEQDEQDKVARLLELSRTNSRVFNFKGESKQTHIQRKRTGLGNHRADSEAFAILHSK